MSVVLRSALGDAALKIQLEALLVLFKIFFNFYEGETKMLRRKGFTLVELMVVILIVAILAAVAIPIMRGRIDSAKWTEGKAMMGTIATSIRAYCAETNADLPAVTDATLDFDVLGLYETDFNGTYFSKDNFSWSVTYTPSDNILTFLITATKPDGIYNPSQWTLDQDGKWEPGPGV